MTGNTAGKVLAAIAVVGAVLWLVMRAWSPAALPGAAEAEDAGPARAAPSSGPSVHDGAPLARDAVAGDAAASRGSGPASTAEAALGSLLVRVLCADDGAPARGVVVRAAERLGRSPATVHERTTDAAGEARFAALGAGRVAVMADRFEAPQLADVKASEETVVVLRTDRGQDIDGVVVDEQDRPIAGAEIWTLRPPNLRPPRLSAQTGANGEFALRAVAAATIVGARASGGRASDFVAGVPDRERHVTLRLVARAGAAELCGRVTDTSNAPVAQARVHLALLGVTPGSTRGAGGERTFRLKELAAQTDSDGRYLMLGLPPGAGSVTVASGRHAPFVRELQLLAGRRTECDACLAPGGALAGTVRGEDGAPVEGAHVYVREEGEREEDELGVRTTAADGRYELHGLPGGTVHAWADAHGKEPARAEVALVVGSVTRWDPVLRGKSTLEGKVVDVAGRPVSGCRVLAENVTHWQNEGGQGVADEQGRFAIPVPPGGRFRFRVVERDSAFPVECTEAGEHASGERDIVLTLQDRVRATASLAGELVDAERRRVALRAAQLTDGTHSPRPQNLAAGDGAFRFARLPPRKYWVDAWPADDKLPRVRLGPYELAPGEARELGKVPFPALGTLKLVVARKDGGPLTRVAAETTPKDGGASFQLDGLGARDTGHLLPPGDYETTLFGEEFMDVEKLPFTIRAGEVTTVKVDLEPAVRRTVRFPVPDPPGWTRSKRATVAFRKIGGELVYEDDLLVRAGQPEQCSPALGIGTYVLTIETDDHRRFEGRFAIESLAPTREPIGVQVRELR